MKKTLPRLTKLNCLQARYCFLPGRNDNQFEVGSIQFGPGKRSYDRVCKGNFRVHQGTRCINRPNLKYTTWLYVVNPHDVN